MQDLRITNKLTSRKIIWVKRVKGLKKKKLKDIMKPSKIRFISSEA